MQADAREPLAWTLGQHHELQDCGSDSFPWLCLRTLGLLF